MDSQHTTREDSTTAFANVWKWAVAKFFSSPPAHPEEDNRSLTLLTG